MSLVGRRPNVDTLLWGRTILTYRSLVLAECHDHASCHNLFGSDNVRESLPLPQPPCLVLHPMWSCPVGAWGEFADSEQVGLVILQ